MADDTSPNQPDAPGDTCSADELDKLLAEATSLADQLADELAESDDTPPSLTDDGLDIDADLIANIDAKLDEAAALCETAVQEVGAEPDDDAPTAPDSTAAEEPPDQTGIPAFMDEFTTPESVEADSKESTATSAAVAEEPTETPSESVPDFMREFTCDEGESGDAPTQLPIPKKIGIVGDAVVVPEDDFAPVVEKKPASDKAAAKPPAPAATRKFKWMIGTAAVRGMVGRCAHSALQLCELGARGLEAADKPLQRVGPRIRLVAGWLALATLGTSVIVFVVSFL